MRLTFIVVGQGGVMTTIVDLQKWDENFYTGKVGGPGFLERQLQQGRLANGTTLTYAFGLTVSQYRGLPMVEHGGSSGGYRTIITRFPSVHTSVAALCNTSDANTTRISRQVSDAVLGSAFTVAATRPPADTARPGDPAAGRPGGRPRPAVRTVLRRRARRSV